MWDARGGKGEVTRRKQARERRAEPCNAPPRGIQLGGEVHVGYRGGGG